MFTQVLLIGIAIIKKSARSGAWPHPDVWAGYMSASNIRFYLMTYDAEHFIQRIQDTRSYKLQKLIHCSLIMLNCFLGVYFGRSVLCERVWYMQRANATV